MRGVTLTELLVGLVVLGIAVAIAIPAWRSYAISVNRSDARRDLLALSAQLQRCFERAADYRVDAAGSSTACVKLPSTNAEATYSVSFAAGEPTRSSFGLVASPLGSQGADTRCGALTLDHAGARGIRGTGAAQECWQEPVD